MVLATETILSIARDGCSVRTAAAMKTSNPHQLPGDRWQATPGNSTMGDVMDRGTSGSDEKLQGQPRHKLVQKHGPQSENALQRHP